MQKQKNQKQIVYADVAIHDMPLRSLLYIGRTYEQLVPVRERYRKVKTTRCENFKKMAQTCSQGR